MYHYLKDAVSETAWRPSAQKLWSQLRIRDHWRIPVEETQRTIDLTDALKAAQLHADAGSEKRVDIVSLISTCAEAINRELGAQHVCVNADQTDISIEADPAAMREIMSLLMEPMSLWPASGSTVVVNVRSEAGDGGAPSVSIDFELRNCEPQRAMQDCVLFTPPLQVAPKRASDYLKASLAIGHIGGRISSPPMENGFKRVHVTLPAHAKSEAKKIESVPKQWLQDLSDEYEKWVLGTLDIAA
jgi:two-component system probable response regulator PhcQ